MGFRNPMEDTPVKTVWDQMLPEEREIATALGFEAECKILTDYPIGGYFQSKAYDLWLENRQGEAVERLRKALNRLNEGLYYRNDRKYLNLLVGKE